MYFYIPVIDVCVFFYQNLRLIIYIMLIVFVLVYIFCMLIDANPWV